MSDEVDSLVEKIHPVYVLLDWKWRRTDGSFFVPSKEDLKRVARQLIAHSDKDGCDQEQGGLIVRAGDCGRREMGMVIWS